MSKKGFGQSQPTKTEKLIERVVQSATVKHSSAGVGGCFSPNVSACLQDIELKHCIARSHVLKPPLGLVYQSPVPLT